MQKSLMMHRSPQVTDEALSRKNQWREIRTHSAPENKDMQDLNICFDQECVQIKFYVLCFPYMNMITTA
jgi:hypothetical protein